MRLTAATPKRGKKQQHQQQPQQPPGDAVLDAAAATPLSSAAAAPATTILKRLKVTKTTKMKLKADKSSTPPGNDSSSNPGADSSPTVTTTGGTTLKKKLSKKGIKLLTSTSSFGSKGSKSVKKSKLRMLSTSQGMGTNSSPDTTGSRTNHLPTKGGDEKNGMKKKRKNKQYLLPMVVEPQEEEKKEMLVSEEDDEDQQPAPPGYTTSNGDVEAADSDGPDSLGDDNGKRMREEDILGEEVELDNDDELSDDVDEDNDDDDDLGDLQQSAHTSRRTPSTNNTRRSVADDIDDYAEIKDSQLITSSPLYNVDLADSQMILDGPPIGEIVANGTDDEDVSEIGEGVADGVIEAEVIDGIEIIYNPLDRDVCFDDRGHPGTTYLIQVLRDLLPQFVDTDYSPPVYKAIKKQLKGRRFLIRSRRDERTSWKEATKPEVIQLLGDCFNEERRRQREGIADDASEIDSSMQDSTMELSEPSDSAVDVLSDDDVILTPCNPPARKMTPRHSNIVPATLPKRVDSIRNGSDGASFTTSQNESFQYRDRTAATADPNSSLNKAIMACQAALEGARPYDDVDMMHKGIAAEEKLLMLMGIADARKTERLKVELTKLEDLSKRIKYASMAPMLEMLETVELHMANFVQICDPNSRSSDLHNGNHSEKNIQNHNHLDSDQERQQDYSGGIRQKRSICIQSDSERDKNEIRLGDDENENACDEALWQNGANDDVENHSASPPSVDPDPRFNRSEGSYFYGDNRGVDADYNDGDAHDTDVPPGSFEFEGESYTMEMNNGSYIEDELDDNLSIGESGGGIEREAMIEKRSLLLLGDESENQEGEGEQVFGADDGASNQKYGNNVENDESYEEYEGNDADEEPKDGGLDISAANVTDGHVLELGDSKEGDELSSVGESVPGIYGSDSDEEDGEMEEIEVLEDDEDDGSRTSESDDEFSVLSPEPSKPKSTYGKPNPKIEQFIDRLKHFFEVRRKTTERAEIMDPSKKFRNLKVKNHSGGIVKKVGKYKKEYQQHDLNDKLVRNLDDLYDAAEPAQSELKFFLQQMVRDVRGLEDESLLLPTLKPRDRAYEKAKSEYGDRSPGPPESWLYDVVRAGVVCKSYKQMSDVNKWLSKNCHVVQVKNRFFEPSFNGYRDLLFHVSIPFREELAHICEIQVHHKDMHALNDQFGLPKHYEFFRSCFAGHWRSQEDILEDLSMMSNFGDIGGPLMKKLLKSKDPEQLRLFAGLCRDKLDEFDRSLELYRRVLNLQEDTHGSEHEQMAATYLSIGLVLGAMGDTDASLLNLQKALAIQESFLGSNHVEVADSYAEIGHMLTKKGDFAGALQQYQRALAIRETKLGKEHFLVIKSLQNIGMAHQEKGDFKMAEAEYRKALKIQQLVLGDVHPDLAATHALIGTTLCQYGEYIKAMEEHRLALSIRETGLGKNHPTTAESHSDIGLLLCQKGEYEFSEWRHRKALRIREAMRGKDGEECAISHGYLGEVLCRRGDYDGAVAELKRAQEIFVANAGMDNPMTAGSYIGLGNIYCRMGQYKEALREFRRAKVIRESILGPTHPDTAHAGMCVGIALNLDGSHEDALTEHRMALSVLEALLGMSHPRTATAYQSIADALLANGDRDEALIQHRKALAVRANVLAKDHPDTATSCSRIGDLLSGKGDSVGALVAYRQALMITIGLCGEDHQESATAHINVGRVLAAQGDLEEAMHEIHQALNTRKTSLGKDHVDTGRAYILMGSLHSMQGDFEKAHEMHTKGAAILSNQLGKKHPETKKARDRFTMAANEEEETELL